MNKCTIKKRAKLFFSRLAIVYSLVSIIFYIALIVTKISNKEILVPEVFKIIPLYLLFVCFFLSLIYCVIILINKEFYIPKLLFILCVNDLLLLLVWLWDPFSLLSVFLG